MSEIKIKEPKDNLATVCEKLGASVLYLMQSTQSLQGRLAEVALDLLKATLSKKPIPRNIRDQLNAIIKDLTKIDPVADEGNIVATTRQMSDDDAKRLIEKILLLYDDAREARLKR